MRREFIERRIAVTEELIEAYEAALLALGEAGGIQSYTLDTSQSRQTVTRADVPRMQEMLNSLYNRLATLTARLKGSTIIGRPGF